MNALTDEVLCARYLENAYYRLRRRSEICHQLPFDRSSLTQWRHRLGEAQLVALLQESLSVAHKTGALATATSARWWSTTRSSRRRSRTPPMRGSAIAPS